MLLGLVLLGLRDGNVEVGETTPLDLEEPKTLRHEELLLPMEVEGRELIILSDIRGSSWMVLVDGVIAAPGIKTERGKTEKVGFEELELER